MKQSTWATTLGALVLALAGCVEDLVVPPPPPKESEVIHYWHFNNLPSGALNEVDADITKVGAPTISYPGTGAGYMDRIDPGSDLNAQSGVVAGYGIRPRNPANVRELLVVASSAGYEQLVVSYAVQRSNNGAEQELFQYSADGGATWHDVGTAYTVATDPEWERKVINLGSITAVNNNANLRLRILFQGAAASGSSGNHRIDNFTIEGIPL